MSNFAPRVFEYDLLVGADATINQTGALEVCGTYEWSLSWCLTGTDPADIWSIKVEYSNDGVKWDSFSCCSEIYNGTQGAFFFDSLPFLNIRINYEVTTTQPGATIDAKLVLKSK